MRMKIRLYVAIALPHIIGMVGRIKPKAFFSFSSLHPQKPINVSGFIDDDDLFPDFSFFKKRFFSEISFSIPELQGVEQAETSGKQNASKQRHRSQLLFTLDFLSFRENRTAERDAKYFHSFLYCPC